MSELLKYKNFSGSVEFDLADDVMHGKIQFIDDVIAYEGSNLQELKQAFQEAVDHYLVHCEKIGKSPDKPFSGSFNVRVGAMLHRSCAHAARRSNLSLNEFVVEALKNACSVNAQTTVEHHHHWLVQSAAPALETTFRASASDAPSDWSNQRVRH